MSGEPSESSELTELEIAFGGLRTSSPTTCTSSFMLVGQPVSSETARVPLAESLGSASLSRVFEDWERQLRTLDSAEGLGRAQLGPHSVRVRQLRSAGGSWTGHARIARAVRAGLEAREVLAGNQELPNRSLPLTLSNRIYVVLYSSRHPRGSVTQNFQTFQERVRGPRGERFESCAVCHSFPCRCEAEAYCIASRRGWPEER